MLIRCFSTLFLLLATPFVFAVQMPAGFVDIQQKIPNVLLDIRYFSENNFVGQPVEGYQAAKCILSKEAASALTQVQKQLKEFALAIKVFDCYRPQTAVNHFVRWAKDIADTKMKQQYYPRVSKKDLFSKGYIAEKSGHSRGSTVDLTLVSLRDGKELDMGTGWDFFSPLSWPSNLELSAQQRANRLLLQQVMIRFGFKPLTEEWWHFTLKKEPFRERYFDFPVQ